MVMGPLDPSFDTRGELDILKLAFPVDWGPVGNEGLGTVGEGMFPGPWSA